jgi:hypothetical protein
LNRPGSLTAASAIFFNFDWLSGSKISPNSVGTSAIRKQDEALIDEPKQQAKQIEPKIKGDKYAKK